MIVHLMWNEIDEEKLGIFVQEMQQWHLNENIHVSIRRKRPI